MLLLEELVLRLDELHTDQFLASHGRNITYSTSLEELVLCSLVRVLEVRVLLVQGDHLLLDIIWEIFARDDSAHIPRMFVSDPLMGPRA